MEKQRKNRLFYVKQFNVRFRTLMSDISNKYPDNIKFKSQVELVNDGIKSLSNRIIINIWNDYVMARGDIVSHIKKQPQNGDIDFFTNINYCDYAPDNNQIYDQMKTMFSMADTSTKKYIIRGFYWLKQIATSYDKARE